MVQPPKAKCFYAIDIFYTSHFFKIMLRIKGHSHYKILKTPKLKPVYARVNCCTDIHKIWHRDTLTLEDKHRQLFTREQQTV